MNLFDIFINFFESLCYCLFIFYILKNKTTSFLSFIIFSFIHFITLCIFNYYLLPEIILILSGIFILFLFSNSINKNEYVQNIFLILLGYHFYIQPVLSSEKVFPQISKWWSITYSSKMKGKKLNKELVKF